MHFDTVNVWDDAVCEDGIVYFSSVVLDIPAHPDTCLLYTSPSPRDS